MKSVLMVSEELVIALERPTTTTVLYFGGLHNRTFGPFVPMELRPIHASTYLGMVKTVLAGAHTLT